MRALLIVVLGSLINAGAMAAVPEESQHSAVVEAQIFAEAMDGNAVDEAALPADETVEQHRQRPNPCKAINADDAQKAAIKAYADKFKTDSAAQVAQVKEAYKNFSAVISDANSDRDAAMAATTAFNTATDSIRASVQAMKLDILYNVLKPEQRASALSCMMMKMAHKGAKHGHHGGHHGTPGHECEMPSKPVDTTPVDPTPAPTAGEAGSIN